MALREQLAALRDAGELPIDQETSEDEVQAVDVGPSASVELLSISTLSRGGANSSGTPLESEVT